MNIFKSVTKKTLKEAKVRTIVTIVGVVLASCLFTAATTFVGSMFKFAEEIEKTSGDYYVHLEDDDNSLYTKMKSDKDIAYMTKENYVGFGKIFDYDTAIKNRIEDGTYNEEVYMEDLHSPIYGIDENCFMINDFVVEAGRMPKTSKEIIISISMAERLGDKGNVGNTINIPILKDGLIAWGEEVEKAFSKDDNNYIKGYQYTIVGHHDNETGYDIYTYNDDKLVSKESNLYVKLHKKLMLDIEEFLARYDVDIDDNEKVKEIKWSLLAFSGSFKDVEDFKIYVWIFTIFFIIIAVASIVLISSTFVISLGERTKQFGLLSSMGATKKQLYNSLMYEASYVSIIGIPVGLLIGLGGMGGTIKLLGHKISRVILSMGTVDRTGIELEYVVYPITIIIALILTVVTVGISLIIPLIRLRKVTAIEAIRQSKEVKVKRRVKVGRLTKKISGLEGILATKYYKISSSKYRVTVISLAISMVLFVVTFSVSGMARIIVDNDMVDYPYDIRYQNIQISYNKNDLRDETTKYKEFLEKLKGLKGAGSVKYSYGDFEGVILKKENLTTDFLKKDNEYSEFVEQEKVEINDSNISDIPEKIYENIIIMYVDDVQYKEILEKEGLDKSKYIGVDEPKALVYNKAGLSEENSCKVFNKDITSLTLVDSEKLDSIAKGYGYNYYYDYNLWPNLDDELKNVEDGKVIYYKLEDNEEEFKKVGIKVGEMYTKELHIGDYISSLPYRSENELYDGLYAIYPESVVKGDVYANAYINVKDYESYITDLYKLLENYDMDLESIEDFCKKNNTVETMLFILKVFIYGFLILIALTSVANVFNTISTNIILRRRDIATLRSIGLSSKSIDKMMRYECFIYGIKAACMGIPLSIVVNYGISKVLGIDRFSEYGVNNIVSYLNIIIPYNAIIISVIVVIVIVYISMTYATNIIKKDNILDTLKNENI